MSLSLHDFLRCEIRKMVISLGRNERGNIYPLIMEEIERSIISLVLYETKNNYLRTSRILGIGRSTLYRRIEALGLRERLPEAARKS